MTGAISFQGVPGAYSDLACRNAYPAMKTLPCPSFEAAIDAVRDGQATLGHAAVRKQPRRPRLRHPPPAAGIRPVHHRRAVPARRTLPAGGQRRHHRRHQARPFPHRRAGPGPPHPGRPAADAGGRGRHRRRRPAGRRMGPQGRRRHRILAGRRDLRPADPARQRRGRRAQHHPLLRRGAQAGASSIRRRRT